MLESHPHVLYSFGLVVALLVGIAITPYARKINITKKNDIKAPDVEYYNESDHSSINTEFPIEKKNVFNEFLISQPETIIISDGENDISVSNISKIPDEATRLPPNSDMVRNLGGLVARVATSALSVPGRTIELVYKPEVAKALKDGSATLMQTRNGEILTTARDVTTGEIIGKARLQQGGQLAQAGAIGFQVVSIIVAQQHMDDIKKMFGKLQSSVDAIKNMLDAEARAEIIGALNHLMKIHSLISSGEMSLEAAEHHRTYIQGVIADTSKWQERILIDLENLTIALSNTTSKDWMGSGDSYNELHTRIQDFYPLMERWKTLVQLCALLNFHAQILGGIEKGYIEAEPDFNRVLTKLETLKSCTDSKIKELIDGTWLNKEETLNFRRGSLMAGTSLLINQTCSGREKYNIFDQQIKLLRTHMLGEKKIIICADDDGNYKDTYIVSQSISGSNFSAFSHI